MARETMGNHHIYIHSGSDLGGRTHYGDTPATRQSQTALEATEVAQDASAPDRRAVDCWVATATAVSSNINPNYYNRFIVLINFSINSAS